MLKRKHLKEKIRECLDQVVMDIFHHPHHVFPDPCPLTCDKCNVPKPPSAKVSDPCPLTCKKCVVPKPPV